MSKKKVDKMKKAVLKDFMEFDLEKAKFLLLKDKKLVPVAFLHTGNHIKVIGLSFKDNEEKNLQIYLLKKLVKEEHADAIIVLAESWYVITDEISIEPSKHPMRKECISIFGECEEGNINITQIFENKDGEITFGKRIDFEEQILNFGIKKVRKQRADLRNLN